MDAHNQPINQSLQTSCPDQFHSSSLNNLLKIILHSKVLSNIYLQVKLQDKDLQYHRFLGPDVREFQHDYFCCWETLLRHFVPSTFFRPAHAKTHSSSFPQVANTVDKSTYVDDVLDSCETTQSAQHLRRQLLDLLAMIAGLKFREWSCNEPVVIEDILNEGRPSAFEMNKDFCQRLGLMSAAGRYVFTSQVEPPRKRPIERNVLTAISSLFDTPQFLQ